MMKPEVKSAILWQKDEEYIDSIECRAFFEDSAQAFGARLGHVGFLVVTNQRILFPCKMGFFAKGYTVTFGINLEDITAVSAGKFGRCDKLVILHNNTQHRDFIQTKIIELIPTINKAITERIEKLETDKEKSRIHILVDFSALKETMSKGGIVMTTYNCPKCNASLEIPESGKVLFCKYCNTPIKPVDIFERIKSFI